MKRIATRVPDTSVTQLDPAIIQKYFPAQPAAKPVVGKKAAPVN